MGGTLARNRIYQLNNRLDCVRCREDTRRELNIYLVFSSASLHGIEEQIPPSDEDARHLPKSMRDRTEK